MDLIIFEDFPSTDTPIDSSNLNNNFGELGSVATTGWTPSEETWTYSSVDDPTGVITIAGDKRSKYSLGMRIKFTNNSQLVYGIITAISYSSPNTTLKFLHEIDPTESLAKYLMQNSAITDNYYSSFKAPYGFPIEPNKWTIKLVVATQTSHASPTDNVYYNLGNLKVKIPIGNFELYYSVMVAGTRGSGGVINLATTLSTTNNSETDFEFTSQFDFPNSITQLGFMLFTKSKDINNTSATEYYLLTKAPASGITIIYNKAVVITAKCNYI